MEKKIPVLTGKFVVFEQNFTSIHVESVACLTKQTLEKDSNYRKVSNQVRPKQCKSWH